MIELEGMSSVSSVPRSQFAPISCLKHKNGNINSEIDSMVAVELIKCTVYRDFGNTDLFSATQQVYLNLSENGGRSISESFDCPGPQRAASQRLSSVGSTTASTQPLLLATNDVFLEHETC